MIDAWESGKARCIAPTRFQSCESGKKAKRHGTRAAAAHGKGPQLGASAREELGHVSGFLLELVTPIKGTVTGAAVTKILASDGTIQATITVGTHPENVAFDGTNIWVTFRGPLLWERRPLGVAWDGANAWVANAGTIYAMNA
jgi:hypothetical protein